MMRRFLLAAALLIATPLMALSDAGIVDFDADDPVMNAAIAEANETLPRFLNAVFKDRKRAANGALLKVAFEKSAEDGHEIIWVDTLTRSGQQNFQGRLANEPRDLAGMRLGSKVQFTRADIRDWAYTDNGSGKLFGHYTTRVIIKQLPQSQRQEIEQVLARSPVPSNW